MAPRTILPPCTCACGTATATTCPAITSITGTGLARIGPLKYVQITYGVTVRFEPADGCDITHFLPEPSKTDEQNLSINSLGYLCHDGCCYGDWSIYYHNGEA